jgi:phenylpropionate dioxygenase-like ring-hydroxylating dioxygenase large terminal subunit
MFEGFAQVWTPVALSGEVRVGAPFAAKVAGTPLVIFRDSDGKPATLVDRCPHRGVALSLGKVVDGCLECPFHGWQLRASGQVCHVPWNPDAKQERLRGVSVPTREVGGQVWIYTDVVAQPPSEPEVNLKLVSSRARVSGFRVVWNAHWTRAMENMLDWPHLPFVHRATIGKNMIAARDARMDVLWETTAWGAETKINIDGKAQPGSLDFRWPNQMNLHIPIPNKLLMMCVACVPIDASHTTMLLVMARDFLKSRVFDTFFHRANVKIANEDKAIVESSFPVEVPPAAEEASVRTDGPTLAFRKRYFAELRGSASQRPLTALPTQVSGLP